MAERSDVWSVEDKVFLVTGGAAGVGAGLVRRLLFHNASHVAFLDVSEREGAALEAELSTKFGALKAKFIKCDIADPTQLATAYNQVLDKYHRLDAVVNNAAVLSADESSYKKMVDINFIATVTSTYKALDIMAADKGGNGGCIVNISSLLALKPSARLPVYAATKAAVLQFSNNIATDELYSNTQVRIATVCLGPTDTAILNRRSLENFDKDGAQGISSRVPERQKVESAVSGILDVISSGENGSTWIVADNKPAVDITENVRKGFRYLTENVAELH
ncbi:15-hydroxyprostaglandin dehydrogenase [NAD(+)]-like [Epargyreus clarus]|uniref:15-hydroxyprostaglandin dehydrogenase [NAD(+)]-like n=1 Tax=Epargyreus clarus TaxID=520877 RepID=UPI003C2BB972